MNIETLRLANDRFASDRKILILENADHIIYDELDFQNGGEYSDHVWLYDRGVATACIDLRSISGVTVYPWPYAGEDEPVYPKVDL